MAPAALVSQRGMIHVLEYSPVEGEHDVPIKVRIHFTHDAPDTVFLRLVIGPRAVATDVLQLDGRPYGAYELTAAAPQLDLTTLASPKVFVTVQALSAEDTVIDSLTFGEFTYWLPGQSPSLSLRGLKKDSMTEDRPRRHSLAYAPSSSPTLKARQQSLKSPRRLRANSLMRTKYPAPRDLATDGELLPQVPMLTIATPLAAICKGWTPAEMRLGRRLVRFHKVQDGRKIIISCETINPEDYQDNDSVISCIYRSETDTFYVTSVDIIYLLERLTNDEFPVEEKNRIRRNLEGLRPTTVSKHRPGFEAFFNKIMEFPEPKPRNIEKDLKVFEWSLLGSALDKILSKYSIYTSSPTDSTISLPPEPISPLLQASQLSYPDPLDDMPRVFKQESPSMSHIIAKDEPRSDSMLFLNPLDTSSDEGSMTFHSSSEHSEPAFTLTDIGDVPNKAIKSGGELVSLCDVRDSPTNFTSCASDFEDYNYDFSSSSVPTKTAADAYA